MLMQACHAPLVGVEVVIQDNGAGVLEEELTMLCEEGFRGQACRRYCFFYCGIFFVGFLGGVWEEVLTILSEVRRASEAKLAAGTLLYLLS